MITSHGVLDLKNEITVSGRNTHCYDFIHPNTRTLQYIASVGHF